MSATEFTQIVIEKISIPVLTEGLAFSDHTIIETRGFDSTEK